MQKIAIGSFTWVNLAAPSKKDIKTILADEYHFHHLAIEDCLSTIQQPKIDDYDDYIFMVFHLPRFIKRQQRTVALELDVFLGKDYLVTVHDGDLKPFNNLFEELKNDPQNLKYQNPSYLLYEILSRSFSYCFPMLEKVAQKLDKVEDDLYVDQSRKTLEEISVLAQDIINFRRIIRPQRYFIKDLESMKSKFIAEDFELYFNDIEDKIDRIWNTLDSYQDVCNVLMRTNESILTQRLNEVIKTLTIISVIMLPLTVITGFYGMNVTGLPFAQHQYAAQIVTAILFIVIATMLYYFKRNRWL